MKKIFYFYIFLLIVIVGINLMNLKDKKYTNFNDIEFNNAIVLNDEIGGYIDNFPEQVVYTNEEVFISGWGYNPLTNNLGEGWIIVLDGEAVLPVEFDKIKRPDIVEAKGNNNLLKSGWETKFSSNILGTGRHSIEIFEVNEKMELIPLIFSKSQSTENTLIITKLKK